MKKFFVVFTLLFASSQLFAEATERYAHEVEKISNQYNTDMRSFLRSLDPKISQFTPQQQAQFCGLVKRYVDDMYRVTDANREHLPPSYMSVTKQNVIDKVMVSPEMQILQKYNIQCDLK